jgi:hypothetical protein
VILHVGTINVLRNIEVAGHEEEILSEGATEITY